MKFLRKLVAVALILLPLSTYAQATHQAVLTWAAPSDAVAGSTYNVHRASGFCPATGLGSLVFTTVNAAPITALTYTDTGLAIGVYCYFVDQTQNGATSLPSNTAGGGVRPNTVTIQIVIS